MTDKELLEYAAKAAGIGRIARENGYAFWDPLTNDGDALKLAVKLGFTIDVDNIPSEMSCTCTEVHAWQTGNVYVYTFSDELDPYAATRRAIVRAAAEIGRAMG